MDLDFTPEQELLGDSVRGLCARHAGLDVVRQLENDPVGYPEKFWTQLAELGLTDLSELSMLDAAIVYRELGRSLAPTPHFVSPFLSAQVLWVAGSDAQKEEWLPKITSAEAIITPAWNEPDRGFGPEGVTAQFVDGRVTGVKRHVAFASSAERLLVLARAGEGGDVVYVLVDPSGSGVTLTQQQTISSDTQYRVELDGAPGEVLPRGGWDVWHDAMLEGCILLAAQAAGGARAALDLAVQYAKDRHQFDKPLGAFQAIAHYLADAVTTVDAAETLAYEAAWARDSGESIARLAPMAKLFATKTFRDVTAMAQQVFGGVGFTVEYDIQLYFRRAKQLQISWWDTRYLEELVATSVLD